MLGAAPQLKLFERMRSCQLLVGAALALARADDPGSGDIGSGFFEPPFIPPRPPFAPPPPSPPPLPPSPPSLPSPPGYPPLPPGRWRICTTCFNARDPEYCRDTTLPCILDEPTWEQWQLAGHGSDESSLLRFIEANASYTAGLLHRAGEQCLYGHTDYLHANASDGVGNSECRPRYEGDTCENPAPKPFACVCVSNAAAFKAQDDLGADGRWYVAFGALGCGTTAAIMLLLRCFVATRDWCRRRFSHGSLQYAAPPSPESTEHEQPASFPVPGSPTKSLTKSAAAAALDRLAAAEKAAGKQVQEEVLELWQCACLTTFGLALCGAPALFVLSQLDGWTQEYWVGCGFLIPDVIVARPEFGANPG